MSREQLINRLMRKYPASSRNGLMDILQDRGFVSDNAVTIEDCADRDLMKAYQQQAK